MDAAVLRTLLDVGMHCLRVREMVWGELVCLHLVKQIHLAGYAVRKDGTDGCRVCFTAREYAIGSMASRLDGCLLRITEVFLPDSGNSSVRALYHRNRQKLSANCN